MSPAPAGPLDLPPNGPLWHGGVPGLRIGDLLEPGHSRDDRHPGCPWCEARARGEGFRGMDPPASHPRHVYLTTDREYARYHASLYGRGDLYLAEPIGPTEYAGAEDPFPAWHAPAARVIAVPERAVLLRMSERRKIAIRWARSDGITGHRARQIAEAEFDDMLRRARLA